MNSDNILFGILMVCMPFNFYFAYRDYDWYLNLAGGKSYIALQLLGRNGFRYLQMALSVVIFFALGYALIS